MKHIRYSKWCVVTLLALGANLAGAHQGHGPISLGELARNALVIVEGRVETVTSAWNADRTQIRTSVQLKPEALYKGGDDAAMVEFALLGGVVGEDGLAIIGQPAFSVGERVVVFLRADWKGNDIPVVQMEHGKFVVLSKPGGDDVLVNAVGARYAKSEVLATIRALNAATIGGRP